MKITRLDFFFRIRLVLFFSYAQSSFEYVSTFTQPLMDGISDGANRFRATISIAASKIDLKLIHSRINAPVGSINFSLTPVSSIDRVCARAMQTREAGRYHQWKRSAIQTRIPRRGKIRGLIYRGEEHVPPINAMLHGNAKENVPVRWRLLAHEWTERIVS